MYTKHLTLVSKFVSHRVCVRNSESILYAYEGGTNKQIYHR